MTTQFLLTWMVDDNSLYSNPFHGIRDQQKKHLCPFNSSIKLRFQIPRCLMQHTIPKTFEILVETTKKFQS